MAIFTCSLGMGVVLGTLMTMDKTCKNNRAMYVPMLFSYKQRGKVLYFRDLMANVKCAIFLNYQQHVTRYRKSETSSYPFKKMTTP